VTERTEAFFSSPNEIVPSQLEGELARLVDALCIRLDRMNARTLLPAKVSGTTRWYAVAPSDRDGRLLREEVHCWLGRPLTTGAFDVLPTSTDLMDRAAIGLVPAGSVLRVDVASGWVDRTLQNVESLTTIWAIEPDRGVDQPRPVGRVLRQFYESVVGNDRAQAEAALDELRGRALLSATNLRFLRVELLSSLGTPQELRDDPLLKDISLLARPPAVTESLAAAADVLLVNSDLTSHPTATKELRSAAECLDAIWPALVTQAYQVTTLATARCFALGQLLLDRPQEQHLRDLSARYAGDPVIAGVLEASGGEQSPPAKQPVTPLSAFYDGDYEAALEIAVTRVADRSTAAIALAAAMNLQDSAAATRALAIVDDLSDADRASLLKGVVERNFFESLQALTSDARTPMDWLDWLNADWPDRPDLLAEWSRTWSRAPDKVAAAADELAETLIDALNDSRRSRVRNGIPVFVEWLISDGVAPSAVSLATTTFDIMLSSEPGKTERQAALSLLEGVLSVGCTTQEYSELLSAITRELSVIGPRDGQWLAQVIDLLLLSACPDSAERTTLIARAAGLAQSWKDRIDPSDAILLGLLFRESGAQFTLPDHDASPGQEAPPFRAVGVYSLMESAIRVVTSWIKERWPDVKVRSSSAAGNSASLDSLVKGVDVMLVQTSHAKHSATGAINMAVTDPSRLVLVHGRGATSLMRALLDWVGAK